MSPHHSSHGRLGADCESSPENLQPFSSSSSSPGCNEEWWRAGVTSDLQVAVLAAGAAAASGGVTPGRAVEETAVFVAAAVLLQDVPHLRLEERHVHVDGHHLNESEAAAPLETDSNCTGNGRTFTFIEQLHLF